jgi:hypothetical protein
LLRPAFLAAVLLEVLCGVLFVAAGQVGWGVFVLAVAVLLPTILLLQTPRLGQAMRHRGYRPGTTMSIDWEPETFTVSTPDSTATHHYVQVARARDVGEAVVLRMRGSRILLVLPAALVPPDVRPRLAAARRP